MRLAIKIFLFVGCVVSSLAHADYRDDIGFTRLQGTLGGFLPTGTGVRVTQVEAAVDTNASGEGDSWMPNANNPAFFGKTITDMSTPSSLDISGHATGVAQLFYGNSGSMTPGIDSIESYSANDWLTGGFLRTGGGSEIPVVSDARIANHSWIGDFDTMAGNASALRRVDWLVETDEYIQVVAMGNGTSNRTLLASAFNAISVGRTDGNHGQGSVAVDADYQTGRTRPDLVAPLSTTSSATPVVASAGALLIDQAHSAALGTPIRNPNLGPIYDGERSEVIKAALMAGADRQTSNAGTTANISDYRSELTVQTDNGLDRRYGAGQVNIFNSYMIIAGGEQDSLEDTPLEQGRIDRTGYDFDAAFGGANGSNRSASYLLDTADAVGNELQFSASLVWNIDIDDPDSAEFDAAAVLHDLNLLLFDLTDDAELLIADSQSNGENTENLWLTLLADHEYLLKVEAAGSDEPFEWDYGLAWQVTAVPIPATAWLFLSALAGLYGFSPRLGKR